jgi:hypothetical protein
MAAVVFAFCGTREHDHRRCCGEGDFVASATGATTARSKSARSSSFVTFGTPLSRRGPGSTIDDFQVFTPLRGPRLNERSLSGTGYRLGTS